MLPTLLLISLGIAASDVSRPETPPESATSAEVFQSEEIEALMEAASKAELWNAPMWHRLVRYRESIFGSYESEADGAGFFVAPNGKTEPKAELLADLRAMLTDLHTDNPTEHPQCRFPARFRWLGEQLGLVSRGVPPVYCPELVKYLHTMRPSKVVLVMASAYLNAPPSMYGHTFLRFDHADHPDALMLSNIINYAANPTTHNPILYSVMGMFGGFEGRFSGMPYYVKIREYSDGEARDLWEYELTLSADQVDWILRYSWELDQTHFDYFFFTENCSYHVLDLFDPILPDLPKDEHLWWVTIPIETIRALEDTPGVDLKSTFRPSHVRKMAHRRNRLNSEELDIATHIAQGERDTDFELLAELEPERRALVLEAAYDYFKYETGFSDKAPKKVQQREMSILRERGRLGIKSEPLDIAAPENPETGHGSARMGLVAGMRNDGRVFQELWLRRSYHDLLDRPAGFIPNSQLEMLALKLRVQPHLFTDETHPQDAILLERFDLMRVASFLPMQPWVGNLSWRALLRYGRVEDLGCQTWSCTAATLEGGPGIAFETRLFHRELYYSLLETHLSAGPAFPDNGRISFSGSAGLILDLGNSLRVHGEVAGHYDVAGAVDNQPTRLRVELGANLVLSQNIAVRLLATHHRDTQEAFAGLMLYD